jgi:hypothetical protein
MILGIMQPYLFPYIGYFQLINAVDKFIFYDDVNFIKNGWINRNKILINNESRYITIHLKNASSNKLINEIEYIDNRKKILKSIEQAYAKAPSINFILPIVNDILNYKTYKISELSIYSVKTICKYLDINTNFSISSKEYYKTKGLNKSERIIKICKLNNTTTYINAIGGKALYDKEYFYRNKITLQFIKPKNIIYSQGNNKYVSGLSIIDVLMWNNKKIVRKMLNDYEIE